MFNNIELIYFVTDLLLPVGLFILVYFLQRTFLSVAFFSFIPMYVVYLFGLFFDESTVPDYRPTILFILSPLISAFIYALVFQRYKLTRIKNLGGYYLKNSRIFAYTAIVISIIQVSRAISSGASYLDPRSVEYALSGAPVLSLLTLLSTVYVVIYGLTAPSLRRFTDNILYILCFFTFFAIPIKTHFIFGLILNLIAVIIRTYKIPKLSYLVILIPFVLILIFDNLRSSGDNDYVFTQELAILKVRQYTSFNISNLSLELNNNNYGLGAHSFGQLLDPVIYLATFGGKRIVDREVTDGGQFHPVDGRSIETYSVGSNMGTYARPFVYDFGFFIGFVVSLLYFLLLLIAEHYFRKKGRLYLVPYSIMLLISIFSFWDLDIFETRYILWTFCSLFLIKYLNRSNQSLSCRRRSVLYQPSYESSKKSFGSA